MTGNEVYIRNLLRSFARLPESQGAIAYVGSDAAERWVPDSFVIRRISSNPFVRLGFDLSRRLRQDMPSLVHVQYTAPINCPVPVVVTVHDVSFVEAPELLSPARAIQLRFSVQRTILQARKVLTVSEFSRRAIEQAYGVNMEKIAVIPNAAEPIFRPMHRATAAAQVERRFGVSGPFLLTVGDLQPRKNQDGLVRSFAALLREYPHLPHRLVLAGKETFRAARVRQAIQESGIADRVYLTGFVTDEELVTLYNACEFFVFPSLYEGFGIPVLEAMACGRAVAASNAAAIPEVADGAAIFFNPKSIPEMTRALKDMILEPELRVRLERLGMQRSAHFSWERSAQETLAVYYDVAGHSASEKARRKLAMARQ